MLLPTHKPYRVAAALSALAMATALIFACTNPPPTKPSSSTTDSVNKHSSGLTSPDTTSSVRSAAAGPQTALAPDGGSNDDEPSLAEVLEQFAKDCRDTVKVDTDVVMLGKKLNIHFRHFSTGDSLIHIPRSYLQVWHLKEFTASNFISTLRVSDGQYILLDTVIRSSMFHRFAFPQLAANGVLFYGGMHFLPDTLVINYSFTIPITDVGIPVHLVYPPGNHPQAEGEYWPDHER